MARYLLRRLLQSLLLLALVSMIAFAILHLAPGGRWPSSWPLVIWARKTSTG